MRKIKMLARHIEGPPAGTTTSFHEGREYEVEDRVAAKLVKNNLAEYTDKEKKDGAAYSSARKRNRQRKS